MRAKIKLLTALLNHLIKLREKIAFESSSEAPQVIDIIIRCFGFCGMLMSPFLRTQSFPKEIERVSSWLSCWLCHAVVFLFPTLIYLISTTRPFTGEPLILFAMSDTSFIFICLVLTYKSWGAVVRPHKWSAKFCKEHFFDVSVVISLVCLCSSLHRLCLTQAFPVIFCGSWRAISEPKRTAC